MSGEELPNLTNVDFTNKRERVTSPRSIEALKSLGYDLNKLYKISFKEYLNERPEIRVMENDIQERRYEHYEKKREDIIKNAIERRQDIIINPDKIFARSNFVLDDTRTQSSFGLFSPQFTYTRREDGKKFDKIKSKQVFELQTLIDSELMMDEIRKKNNIKFKEIQEKEEEIRREKFMKSLEKKRKREKKDTEIEKKFREDEIILERRIKEMEEEEQTKKLIEMKKKELEEREIQEKQIKQRRKDEEMKRMLDDNFESHIKSLEERQKIVLIKEQQRKRLIEDKKLENIAKARENAEKARQKVDKTIMIHEEKNRKQKEDFEIKHKFLEDTKKKAEMEKIMNLQKQQEINKLKEEEILRQLKKNEEIEMKKAQEFEKRQESLEKRKRQKEMEMRRTMSEKIIKHQKKEDFVIHKKTQYEVMKEEYDRKIKEKINKLTDRVYSLKQQTYREMLIKYDNLQIKREDNFERYLSNEKAHEYSREKRFESIIEKMKKIDEIRVQNQLFAEEKRRKEDRLRRKKEIMLEKFEKIAQKAHFNKDEFYREVFTPTSLALISPNHSQEFFSSAKMMKSIYNITTDRGDSSNNTGLSPSQSKTKKVKENDSNVVIKDSKFDFTSSIKNINEESFSPIKNNPNNNETTLDLESKKKMTNEEIESLIDNKRSELDIKLFDMVTKNQVEEKKLEEVYNNQSNEEEKAKLLENLEKVIKNNENAVNNLKEKNKKLVEEYEEKLKNDSF